jgi:hypothetical protein
MVSPVRANFQGAFRAAVDPGEHALELERGERPTVPGGHLPRVLVLRTMDDSTAIREAALAGGRLLLRGSFEEGRLGVDLAGSRVVAALPVAQDEATENKVKAAITSRQEVSDPATALEEIAD